ncbi:MAG: efflux RND transporter periplasmic adaptor subunit [Chloroflexi bacterium]|nr:efflux RND transporter periplasmic adaptor subunit [Chloroflexota bacterium]
MSRRTAGLFLAILLVLVAVGGYLLWFRGRGQPENTAIVRRGTLVAKVDALGRVQPLRRINLSTRASGQVRAIYAREGDQVDEGALLLELDALEYEQALEQVQRSVEIREQQLQRALSAPEETEIRLARARLRRATVARAVAQADYDELARSSDADQRDIESSDEALALEAAKLDYEIAEAEFERLLKGTPDLELERLRLDLLQARHALQQAERRLEDARIRAPFAGTVLQVSPQVGENVHGFTPLIELADLTAFHIVAQIDELDIASIREGQQVEVRLDAFPGKVLEGQVDKVLPALADTRGATIYEAYVRFDPAGLAVRAGMGANLSIMTEVAEDVLLVPRRAVEQLGRYQVVQVLEGRNKRQVVVTTGLTNDSDVEILSGLEEGQIVVLN